MRTSRIELAANICVLAAAVLFVVSVSWWFLRQYSSRRTPPSSIQAGTRLTLPDVEWSINRCTLVLFLSTDCKYCTANTPLYRRLVERAALTHTSLVAVFPQTITDGEQYLMQHEIRIDTVRQVAPAALGVTGTPTLIMVDDRGTVIRSWQGMIPAQAEKDVLALVK